MKVDKSKWKKLQFNEIAESQLGKTLDAKKNRGTAYPHLCAVNVGNGFFNLCNIKNIKLEDSEIERYLVKQGDLLVCEGGDTGRCAIWESDKPIFYQNSLHRVRCKSIANVRFVMYSMHYYKHVGIIDNLSHGQTIKHFTQKGLNKLSFNLPTIKEQKEIVAELDSLQAMIDGYKAQITDLDELAQSLFLDTFGDPVTNPKGWEIKTLGDVCLKITDGTHASPKFTSEGIPFIFVSNVVNYEITYDVQKHIDEKTYSELWKSTPVEKGDIIYTSVGSYGNPAIVRDERKFMFQRHIALMKIDHTILNSEFVKWFLISPAGKNQADEKAIGIAQKTLNLKAIKSFELPLPPLALQELFAARVKTIEALKGKLREQVADSELLMAERMQYYFNYSDIY